MAGGKELDGTPGKGPDSSASADATECDSDAGASGLSGFEAARRHHYVFAYSVLPQFVYWDARKFQEAAMNNRLTGVLRGLFDRVGKDLVEEERIPSDGLMCVVDQVDGFTRVIIAMPPTQRPIEAIMIAVLISLPRGFLTMRAEPEVLILTLEQSYPDEDGKPQTCVGVLGRDGSHGSFGQGPNDLEGFTLWTAQYIRQRAQ
ncbi:MAG TPA: hypothetical protein V6D08_17610 [Candidatus Obscuribacterales bacterium]